MKIVIDIPEKEFGIDINDKFQDFFNRLKSETKNHLINQTNLICGAYELETIDMFLKAFDNGTPLPKGYGRLIDADAYRKELRIEIPNLDYDGSLEPYEEGIYSAIMSLDDAPTIIEADKAESEENNDESMP